MGWLYYRRALGLQNFEQIGNALKRGCLGITRQAEQQQDGHGPDDCSQLPHGSISLLQLGRFMRSGEIRHRLQ
jgi:hypothetical protein